MVGHTGVIPAAVAAVEAVDACLGRVVEAVVARRRRCLITADHGNSDHMLEPDGSPNTAHSTNLVPFIATAARACACARAAACATSRPRCSPCWASPSPPEMTGALPARAGA